MALLCVTRHVTSGESAHHLRCVLPYYAVRDIRHGVRCPGNDVNRFMCVPGQISLSRFSISPLFEQPGQKHPRKIANSALPHNIRHHTSAEFRASGFAYIERSRDGLSRFPKRGQNHEPGQRNLARFARQSVAVTTGTPTAHRYTHVSMSWDFYYNISFVLFFNASEVSKKLLSDYEVVIL